MSSAPVASSVSSSDIKEDPQEETGKKQTMKVTLLSGFLGSGKTTLLKRILRSNNDLTNDKKLKIAVIVNDMGEINLDAEEIKSSKVIQEDSEMVEMHNGCICCTLRGDLLKTVKSLSQESNGFDYLVIESTGISEPIPVAQTFVMDVDSMTPSNAQDHDHAGHNHDSDDGSNNQKKNDDDDDKNKLKVATDERKSLFHFAKLDTLVTVVDPINMYDVLSSMETLADKDNASGMTGNAPSVPHPGQSDEAREAVRAAAMNMPNKRLRDALEGRNLDTKGSKKQLVDRLIKEYEDEISKAAPSSGDTRTIAKLWLDQIEFANVIIISKVPQFLERNNGDTVKLKEIEGMLSKLNPDARIIVPYGDKYSDLDVTSTLINTGLFDMEKARHSASWTRELEKEHHNPETEEYGISSTTFTAKDMPFHPERLHAVLGGFGDMFIALVGGYKKSVGTDDSKNNDGGDATANKRVFKGVVRIKGQIWLANCNVFALDFQTAGRHVEMQPSDRPFMAEIDRVDWTEDEKVACEWMEENGWWSKKWGDRCSQLVFIGVGLDPEDIHKTLQKALLTKEESAKLGGVKGWRKLKDPFYNGQLLERCDQYHAWKGAMKDMEIKKEEEKDKERETLKQVMKEIERIEERGGIEDLEKEEEDEEEKKEGEGAPQMLEMRRN